MGRGQPRVHGEHAGLHAEAHQHGKHDGAQQVLVARHLRRIQHAAGGESKAGAVVHQEEDTQQRRACAEHRVDQVLDARRDGLLLHGVHHQGQGNQGHHLIEHVHGHGVGAHAQAHQHAVGTHVEAVEAAVVGVVGVVGRGVDPHQHPHHGDERHVEACHAVGAQLNGDGVGQPPQSQARIALQRRRQRAQRGDGQRADGEAVRQPAIVSGQRPDQQRRRDGKNQGKDQQHGKFLLVLIADGTRRSQ